MKVHVQYLFIALLWSFAVHGAPASQSVVRVNKKPIRYSAQLFTNLPIDARRKLESICRSTDRKCFYTEEQVAWAIGPMAVEAGYLSLLKSGATELADEEDGQEMTASEFSEFLRTHPQAVTSYGQSLNTQMEHKDTPQDRETRMSLDEIKNVIGGVINETILRLRLLISSNEVKLYAPDDHKKPAPILDHFKRKFVECAPRLDCVPFIISLTNGRGHASCHPKGMAIDLAAVICKSGFGEDIRYDALQGDAGFLTFVKCMTEGRDPMAKVMYQDGGVSPRALARARRNPSRFSSGAITTKHYNHAHFSDWCYHYSSRTKKGRWIY